MLSTAIILFSIGPSRISGTEGDPKRHRLPVRIAPSPPGIVAGCYRDARVTELLRIGPGPESRTRIVPSL